MYRYMQTENKIKKQKLCFSHNSTDSVGPNGANYHAEKEFSDNVKRRGYRIL